MMFTESPLAGAYVLDMTPAADERGFFARTFCADEFTRRGLSSPTSQSSISFNAKSGTLRGLHFQAPPHEEDKLVRCTGGSIFDVIVDMRSTSRTHRQWFGIELTAVNRLSLFVPKGFAHGFISLSDATEVLYMMSVPFAAQSSRGIRWNDPALRIRWPREPSVISERDATYALLDAPIRT